MNILINSKEEKDFLLHRDPQKTLQSLMDRTGCSLDEAEKALYVHIELMIRAIRQDLEWLRTIQPFDPSKIIA